ncbi:hypothetical protein GCM10011575_34270 [Microlunatus endophyticus]|uniref:DUF2470 domain-containing protein n=1 Tax=Microlunatus endophyticus TaxID=1716077 RepID=A0A917SD05_9ACTN|nr:hypothetical protein [Microlunatus endophyticus]GGL73107.1 hypothetical protein GCM10011575_34270 [Microlunatus endophyticus]
MVYPVKLPLARLSPAVRARSVVAAGGSLDWATDAVAGSATFYEQYGAPMLLSGEAMAADLLAARLGRVRLALHPRIGVVNLSGVFWPLAARESAQIVEAFERGRRCCPDGSSVRITRVIGLRVTHAAVLLPGAEQECSITMDDYDLAWPDPVVAVGAHIAAHLNDHHQAEVAALGATLLDVPVPAIAGVQVGPVDGDAFELSVLDSAGAHVFVVPLPEPVRDPALLPEAIREAIAIAGRS